jgi:hypothetical protein
MLKGPFTIVVDGHELYETNVIRMKEAHSRQIQNLVIIDASHYYYIYFYWIESEPLSGLNSPPHPVELITTGDAKKFITLESVKTNIDAANTCSIKLLGEFLQQYSIGSEA